MKILALISVIQIFYIGSTIMVLGLIEWREIYDHNRLDVYTRGFYPGLRGGRIPRARTFTDMVYTT